MRAALTDNRVHLLGPQGVHEVLGSLQLGCRVAVAHQEDLIGRTLQPECGKDLAGIVEVAEHGDRRKGLDQNQRRRHQHVILVSGRGVLQDINGVDL